MPNKPKRIEVLCKTCNVEFITTSQNIKRGHGNFCSAKCRYSSFKENYECSYCKVSFVGTKSRKSKSKTATHFCSNDCKYKAASSLDNAYMTGPKGKSTGEKTYRNRALNLLDNKCSCCNYSEYIELLDVDHIDGNRKNSDISNLQILCVKCHALKTRLPDEFQRIYGVKINRKCKGCDVELNNNKSFYCFDCSCKISKSYVRKSKISWPTVEEVTQLISSQPILKVAKKLGVTDNAIRRFCKKNNIDYLKLSKFSHSSN